VNRRHFLRTAALVEAGGLIAGRVTISRAAEMITLPFPMLTEDEIKILSDWILSRK